MHPALLGDTSAVAADVRALPLAAVVLLLVAAALALPVAAQSALAVAPLAPVIVALTLLLLLVTVPLPLVRPFAAAAWTEPRIAMVMRTCRPETAPVLLCAVPRTPLERIVAPALLPSGALFPLDLALRLLKKKEKENKDICSNVMFMLTATLSHTGSVIEIN